jgi:RNA polymerase sigma-70 factor (ECF subfamily)
VAHRPGAGEPDAALVTAARRGDREALETLLRRHHDRVHALCRRMTGNDADALDATQEALLAVCRGLDRFDGRAAFTTWLYRVATNACLDELRRRGRRPVPMDAAVSGADEHPPARAADSQTGAVDEQVTRRLDIDAALATLPDDFRVAVVLRDLCDLDYADISEVLGIPPGTVRSRIARGRAALARVLGNQPDPGARQTTRP